MKLTLGGKIRQPIRCLSLGGAEGNLRSLSRLTAALRSAHAFSLTPLWCDRSPNPLGFWGAKTVPRTVFPHPSIPFKSKQKSRAMHDFFVLVEPRGIEPF